MQVDEVSERPQVEEIQDNDQLSQLLSVNAEPFGDLDSPSTTSAFKLPAAATRPAIFKSYLQNPTTKNEMFREEVDMLNKMHGQSFTN